MNQYSKSISCEKHGEGKAEAFVCEHFITGRKLGFYYSKENSANLFPDAWCRSCERIRQEYNGWNEQSESLITVKLICGDCYAEIKVKNDTTE